ncbi:MAG: poly-gamma-glutamate biosynthesis protein PgsC/CapC, partial [candidate division WOR-3 bacterium]
HEPDMVLSTVLVALVTFILVKIIANYILLYGRRLLIICVIIGYLIGYLTRLYPALSYETLKFDITTIGFVVPGLIAYWMHRQGIIETISTMLIAAVFVRFILIIITGGVLYQ